MRKKLSILISVLIVIALGVGIYFAVPNIFGSVIVPLPDEYKGLVEKYAKLNGLDPCLVAAVINGESRWNAGASSHVGAQGLMQVMPATKRAVEKKFGLPSGPATDPESNIRVGTRLLRYNFDSYGSLRNVLVAYNAGGSRVVRPDNQLPKETQFYIVKITRYYELYKAVYPTFCAATTSANPKAAPEPDLPDFVVPAPIESPDLLDPNNFWKAFLPES
ncbi:MAG TPA: lytic transglycosylase domain-containing protein [Patescibacteria group bacterium]